MIFRGQTVRASADVQIELEDGSYFALSKGAAVTYSDCLKEDEEAPPLGSKHRVALLLGKIWVKIAKPLVIEIQTERTGIAPRGTVFSVEYDPKTQTTVVEVEKGLVEVRNLLGTLQTLVVEAGQMAIQTGHQPPRLKR